MSSSKTETAAPEAAQTSNAQQGSERTLGNEELPPHREMLPEDLEDAYVLAIDLMAGATSERELFEGPYNNADELVADYRTKLLAIVQSDSGIRAEAYHNLQKFIRLHRKAIYKPVKDAVFAWANGGYEGDSPTDFYDELDDGSYRTREMSNEPDAEYINRKDDLDEVYQEDEVELPPDMTPYQKLWDLAAPLLVGLYAGPRRLLQDKMLNAFIKLNRDISALQKKNQYNQLDFQVPYQEIAMALVTTTQALYKANSSDIGDRLTVLKAKVKRAQQPDAWITDLEKAILQKLPQYHKFKNGEKGYSSALWPDDYLQKLGRSETVPDADKNRQTETKGSPRSKEHAEGAPNSEKDSGRSPEHDKNDEAKLPSDMTPYQKQWDSAIKDLTSIYENPRSLFVSSDKLSSLELCNRRIVSQQRTDKCKLDLQIPYYEILTTLVTMTHKLAKDNVAREDIKLDRLGSLKSKWEKAHLPKDLVLDLWEVIRREVQAHKDAKGNLDALWPSDFLEKLADAKKKLSELSDEELTPTYRATKSLEQERRSKNGLTEQRQPSAQPEEQASTSTTERRRPSAQPEKQGSTSTSDDSKSQGPFERSKLKGFQRYKMKPDYVLWKNRERKIGGVRGFGLAPKHYTPSYQVLVQMNQGDEYCVWDLVPASEFDRGVVTRYLNSLPSEDAYEINSKQKKGTREDLGDATLDQFNFGGIARAPGGECRRGDHFIYGMVGDDEKKAKFFSKSVLAQAWRAKAVEKAMDAYIKAAGRKPTPVPLYKAIRMSKKAKEENAKEERFKAELSSDEGYESIADDSDGSVLDYNDGRYENEEGDDFVASESEVSDRERKRQARERKDFTSRSVHHHRQRRHPHDEIEPAKAGSVRRRKPASADEDDDAEPRAAKTSRTRRRRVAHSSDDEGPRTAKTNNIRRRGRASSDESESEVSGSEFEGESESADDRKAGKRGQRSRARR